MDRIRVMIVEDSAVVRMLLEGIIGEDPRLQVVASVGSAEEAIAKLRIVAPQVISMDIRLPGMDGIEAIRRIMADIPTPIVVVSAGVGNTDLKISMEALRAGALSVVEKPLGPTHAEYLNVAKQICSQLFLMSDVKLILRREFPTRTGAEERIGPIPGQFRMLGLVASTGGPPALVRILNGLPREFPLPIAIVQHIIPAFLDGFAAWLNEVCPLPVSVALQGEVPLAGRVYVAPANAHLTIQSGRFRLVQSAQVSYQCPSGTVLFQSMARSLGPSALAVLLTGMGDDGAEGMSEIRKAGGYTLAEDATTAVVYGMPDKAVKLGAVLESMPLQAIAPRLLKLTGSP